MDFRGLLIAVLVFLTGLSCSKPGEIAGKDTYPIKLGTYTDLRERGVTNLFIHSPWNPKQYAALGFPEHCWGNNLPNTSHDSKEPVRSPWRISGDSTEAVFERNPREGVLYRARAVADSMAVKLSVEIINDSDVGIEDIRSLICFKPAAARGLASRSSAMAAFRDTSYEMTWFPVDGKPVQLHEDTHYQGDYPDRGWTDIRTKINWGVNIRGGRDNRTIRDMGWFRGNSPGRIVEEEADPALIAIHARGDTTRWVATIWNPVRILFCNPQNPCFHSDPDFPDCPAGGETGAEGIIFFHEGTFQELVKRALAWRESRK